MIEKLGFFAYAIALSVSVTAADVPDGMEEDRDKFYWPFIAMQACTDIPPDGYFLTELRYSGSSTQCFGKWIYIFESYFDKPLGHQMEICSPTLPWLVPGNWHKIRETVAVKCARRLGEAGGAAWIVQRAN